LLVPVSVPELPVLPDALPPPLVAPLAPLEALGEDEPEDLAFLAFLVFFLALGLVSAVASVAPAAEEPEVAPVEPLPVVESVALGEVDEPEVEPLPVVPVVDEPEVVPVEPVPVEDDPDAPLPVVPDAPDEVSLLPLPEAPEPVLPLAPEVPDVAPGCGVLDGTELEVPLPPAMPASLPVPAPVAPVALCDFTVGSELVVLLPVCARAMDDTDATTTSDSERRVDFNVMSCSFSNWNKGITDAAAWMQRLPPCSAVLTPHRGK
jgi:hypothetical protein